MDKSIVTSSKIDNATVLINAGQRLDNNNASDMAFAICTAQAGGITDIRIDLSELELLSSAGIGSILGSVEVSREAGGDITLWNPSEKIMHILEVLDVADYLTIKAGSSAAIV